MKPKIIDNLIRVLGKKKVSTHAETLNERRHDYSFVAKLDDMQGRAAPRPACVVAPANTRDVVKDDFVAADGLIVGSPVYFGTMAAQLKLVLDEFVGVRKKMENKVGATFSTAGDASGGKETTMMSIIQALLIYGMIIVGDPMSATGHYGTACVGAPDDAARQNGQRLGRRVAELVNQLRR